MPTVRHWTNPPNVQTPKTTGRFLHSAYVASEFPAACHNFG